jgi:hypothetical protein
MLGIQGLRLVAPNEKEFPLFQSHGIDLFEEIMRNQLNEISGLFWVHAPVVISDRGFIRYSAGLTGEELCPTKLELVHVQRGARDVTVSVDTLRDFQRNMTGDQMRL